MDPKDSSTSIPIPLRLSDRRAHIIAWGQYLGYSRTITWLEKGYMKTACKHLGTGFVATTKVEHCWPYKPTDPRK